MRFFIHIAAGRTIDYDGEGAVFVDLEDARGYAIEFLRLAYMTPDRPPTDKLRAERRGRITDPRQAVRMVPDVGESVPCLMSTAFSRTPRFRQTP
jgi:hypothetical protein